MRSRQEPLWALTSSVRLGDTIAQVGGGPSWQVEVPPVPVHIEVVWVAEQVAAMSGSRPPSGGPPSTCAVLDPQPTPRTALHRAIHAFIP
jgi:hypothetical protein